MGVSEMSFSTNAMTPNQKSEAFFTIERPEWRGLEARRARLLAPLVRIPTQSSMTAAATPLRTEPLFPVFLCLGQELSGVPIMAAEGRRAIGRNRRSILRGEPSRCEAQFMSDGARISNNPQNQTWLLEADR